MRVAEEFLADGRTEENLAEIVPAQRVKTGGEVQTVAGPPEGGEQIRRGGRDGKRRRKQGGAGRETTMKTETGWSGDHDAKVNDRV